MTTMKASSTEPLTSTAGAEGEDTTVSNNSTGSNRTDVIIDVDEIMTRNQEEAGAAFAQEMDESTDEKDDIKDDKEKAAVATEEVDGASKEEAAEAAQEDESRQEEEKKAPSKDQKNEKGTLSEELQQQTQAALQIFSKGDQKKGEIASCDGKGNDTSTTRQVYHEEAAANQMLAKASLPKDSTGGKTDLSKHDDMISKSDNATASKSSFGEQGGSGNLESLFTSQIQPLPEPGSSNTARSRADGVPGAHAIAGVPPRFWNAASPMRQSRGASFLAASTATNSTTTDTVVEGDALVTALPSELVVEEGSDDATMAANRVKQAEDEEAQLSSQVVIEGKLMPEKKKPTKSSSSAGKGGNRTNINDDVAWWKSSWFVAVSICTVLVVLIVASTLGLLLGGPTADDDSSPPSSGGQGGTGYQTTIIVNGTEQIPEADYELFPPFRDDLHQFTLDEIQHAGSVYYWANRWMLNDPNLETYSYDRSLQRFGLVMTYYTTHGDNWTRSDHWLSYDVSECEWYSHCSMPEYEDTPNCDEDGHIIKIALASNNLQGSFVRFSGSFPYLKIYDLADNKIHGKVPHIVDSPATEVFILSNNEFEGQLSGDGGFSSFGLRVAKIDNNNFAGYHAALLGYLRSLEILNITGNYYEKEIPKEIANCENITYIGAGHNLFTGVLPSEFGVLAHLQEIDISGNRLLEGTIPSELGAVTTLKLLDVSETPLVGSVPTSLCQRVQDSDLIVSANCSQMQCCE